MRWPWGHGALGQKGETEIKDYSILWPRIILRLISSGPDSVNGKSERSLLLWSAYQDTKILYKALSLVVGNFSTFNNNTPKKKRFAAYDLLMWFFKIFFSVIYIYCKNYLG